MIPWYAIFPTLQIRKLKLRKAKQGRGLRSLEWLTFPPREDLPDPGIETTPPMSLVSPALQLDDLSAEPSGNPQQTHNQNLNLSNSRALFLLLITSAPISDLLSPKVPSFEILNFYIFNDFY